MITQHIVRVWYGFSILVIFWRLFAKQDHSSVDHSLEKNSNSLLLASLQHCSKIALSFSMYSGILCQHQSNTNLLICNLGFSMLFDPWNSWFAYLAISFPWSNVSWCGWYSTWWYFHNQMFDEWSLYEPIVFYIAWNLNWFTITLFKALRLLSFWSSINYSLATFYVVIPTWCPWAYILYWYIKDKIVNVVAVYIIFMQYSVS